MRGVDVVVGEGLVHVLVDVQSVKEDRCVLIGHEVATEPVDRQPTWGRCTGVLLT